MKKVLVVLAAALPLLHEVHAVRHQDDSPDNHAEWATDATREVSSKGVQGGRHYEMAADTVRYAHAVGSAGFSEARAP